MSRHRSKILRAYVLAAIASVILSPAGDAFGTLDIQQVSLFTVKNWQGGVLETKPYEFWVMVQGDDITSVTLTTPLGTVIDLVESMGFWVSDEDVRYKTLGKLRVDYPIGDYTFVFNKGESDADSVTVYSDPDQPTGGFVDVTYPRDGAINVPLNPTFIWDAYTGSGNNLYMDVGDEEGTLFIQSATNDTTQTSWTPGTLVPGHLHSFEIAAQSITTTNNVKTSHGDELTFCDFFDYNNEILFTTVDPTVITVEIDIKPGSDPNPINPDSKGLVPVAILSSKDFDARTVDEITVELAGAPVAMRGKNKYMAHEEDVNGDGLIDLVVQVETSLADWGAGGTVKLTGETFSCKDIVGYDKVVIVQPGK
jgi:hypothetical protein